MLAKLEQLRLGLLEFAQIAHFRTLDDGALASAPVQIEKGGGFPGGWVVPDLAVDGDFGLRALDGHFGHHGGLFVVAESAEVPFGFDHALNVEVFHVIARGQDGEKVGGERDEGVAVFAGEEEDIGEQGVFGPVHGGDALAESGGGAVGFGSVEAGGGFLSFCAVERHGFRRAIGALDREYNLRECGERARRGVETCLLFGLADFWEW